MQRQSRHRSLDVLSGYVQSKNLFVGHAGAGLAAGTRTIASRLYAVAWVLAAALFAYGAYAWVWYSQVRVSPTSCPAGGAAEAAGQVGSRERSP